MKLRPLIGVLLILGLILAYGCSTPTNEPASPAETPTDAAPPAEVEDPSPSTEEASKEDETDYDEAPETDMPISVHHTRDVVVGDYEEFIADESEHQVRLVFMTEREVKDFKLLALTLDEDVDSDEIKFDTEELYILDPFTPEKPLVVRLTFLGTIPNYGISYEDGSGMTRYFTLSESGRDGSLQLIEFDD